MWRDITRANSSHIVGKLVTVGQGLKQAGFPWIAFLSFCLILSVSILLCNVLALAV